MAEQKVVDIVILGAGIAGVSLAYRIGRQARVLVLETESQPGYHSSGRSAAMFMETYGTPTIQALTRASRSFFEAPPAGFAETPLLTDRGVLYLVREDQLALKEAMLADLKENGALIHEVSAQEVLDRVPCVRADGLVCAIEEPDAKDVDVHVLLQGFLRGAREAGTQFEFNCTVVQAQRQDGHWLLTLSNGDQVQATTVVNAAGAWAQRVADQFGALNVGLQPKRRSAFTFKATVEGESEPVDPSVMAQWPAVVNIDESYYFKPDAGQLLGSPANADPVEPHDVVAEEWDVAVGIDRIMTATTLSIRRPSHTWAGLRSFVSDGDFVMGWDPSLEGFFWLAAQGGYGIQTSPGASQLACNLLLNQPLSPELVAYGVDPDKVAPKRFASA